MTGIHDAVHSCFYVVINRKYVIRNQKHAADFQKVVFVAACINM